MFLLILIFLLAIGAAFVLGPMFAVLCVAVVAGAVVLRFTVPFFAKWFESEIIPMGYFSHGLLQWGSMFTSEQYISKGIELRGLSDIRALDDAGLDELYDRNMRLVAMAQPGDAIKIHFVIEDDYAAYLDKYDATTDKTAASAPPWVTMHRKITSKTFRNMSEQGQLSREKVYLYWCKKVDSLREMGGKAQYNTAREWLRQQSVNMRFQLEQVARLYGCSYDGIMGDEEHCLHLRKWANPSLAYHWAGGTKTVEDLDTDKTIAHNVLRSDGPAFTLPSDQVVLKFDGMFHAFYVVDGRSRGSDINKTRGLLSAVQHGVHIVQTIYPLEAQSEVERGQSIIRDLETQKSPKQGNVDIIASQQADIQRRVKAISEGQTIPCNCFWAIHVWGPTMDVLNERTTKLKSALTAMDGLRYKEINHPETARRVFSEMCPGWAGSDYRGWDVYWENVNLADLMPVSSSFTGFLEQADALLMGDRHTIVGVRLFDHFSGTPQFAVNIGKTGSGKTSDAINLISQAGHLFGFSAIFDEGLAWHTTAQMLGLNSAILREGNTPTVNPFDTCGLPRTGALFSEIASVAMKLVGLSESKDTNENRRGLIEQYARVISDGVANDYLQSDQKREVDLARELCAVLKLKEKMREESDLIDAYVAWLELGRNKPEEITQRLQAVPQSQITEYLTEPGLRVLLLDYVYTRITPQATPRWSMLAAAITYGRLPEHSGADASETLRNELDALGTRISRGNAGGVLGNFLDGVSNLAVQAPGIYVETSFLPNGSLLRELAPLVILGRLRRYIITRPRKELKMVLFEEFKKLAEIPGIEAQTKENLAQFRKYNAWFCANFQDPAQIDEVNPSLTNLLFGQSSQFWLHCMPAPSSVQRTGDAIGLPQTARRAILGYPMLADQPPHDKSTFMHLFAPTGNGTCITGTTRNYAHPYLLYVVSSNGEIFDERQEAMRGYPTAYEGVIAEVQKKMAAKQAKAA